MIEKGNGLLFRKLGLFVFRHCLAAAAAAPICARATDGPLRSAPAAACAEAVRERFLAQGQEFLPSGQPDIDAGLASLNGAMTWPLAGPDRFFVAVAGASAQATEVALDRFYEWPALGERVELSFSVSLEPEAREARKAEPAPPVARGLRASLQARRYQKIARDEDWAANWPGDSNGTSSGAWNVERAGPFDRGGQPEPLEVLVESATLVFAIDAQSCALEPREWAVASLAPTDSSGRWRARKDAIAASGERRSTTRLVRLEALVNARSAELLSRHPEKIVGALRLPVYLDSDSPEAILEIDPVDSTAAGFDAIAGAPRQLKQALIMTSVGGRATFAGKLLWSESDGFVALASAAGESRNVDFAAWSRASLGASVERGQRSNARSSRARPR